MKKCLFCVTFILLTAFSSTVLWGDVIELDNGSKIIGQIEKIGGGKVHVKTDFAGTLEIDMARVANLLSDNPVFVAFTSGNRLYGKVNYTKEQTQVDMPDGNTVVTKDAIAASWLQGQLDPLAPSQRKWSYSVGVDFAGKSGNTEKFTTGGRTRAILKGPVDRLLFYLRWAYSKEDGEKSDDEVITGIDYESDFGERHVWYSRIELEKDNIKDLDLRSTAAVGYGYYFIKKSDHTLRGRTGIMYRHEDYANQNSENTLGLDLGFSQMYKLSDSWRLLNDITWTPSVEDIHDYRFYHESAFEVPLGNTEIWKLQLGVTNDYDSEPAEGKDRLDTTYFTRLVLEWN